jgi:predicted RecA/RadA family phage recombinase
MSTEADTIMADPSVIDITTTTALEGGRVIQLPDGRAGVVLRDKAATTAAAPASVVTSGLFSVVKTSGVVLLDGGRVFWDHSANAATFRVVNDRDFFLGTAVGDTASTATAVVVNLNVDQRVDIDIRESGRTIPVGTAAAGGFGNIFNNGAVPGLALTATNEAQKSDLLSEDRRAVSANGIAEFIVRLGANGSTSDVDINIGVANATHATDADSITESVFFHIDGGSLNILAESDDGTTEVAATDTTVDITAGSAVANRVEFWIDMRNPADIQLYIDGVNVLPSSVFTLAAATGPVGLLAHVEKTSGTATAGPVYIDRGILRTSE